MEVSISGDVSQCRASLECLQVLTKTLQNHGHFQATSYPQIFNYILFFTDSAKVFNLL